MQFWKWVKVICRKMLLVSIRYEFDMESIQKDNDKDKQQDVEIRKMKTFDLYELKKKYPKELSERKFNLLINRIGEKRTQVYAIEIFNSIAGYSCVSCEPTYESGMRKFVQVKEGEVYYFDNYIFEEYRGHGGQKEALRLQNEIYKKKGYKKSFAMIYSFNKISINNYLRNGFVENGKILAIRPFRVTFIN